MNASSLHTQKGEKKKTRASAGRDLKNHPVWKGENLLTATKQKKRGASVFREEDRQEKNPARCRC